MLQSKVWASLIKMEIGRTEIFLDKELFKIVVKAEVHLRRCKILRSCGWNCRAVKMKR